MKKLFGCAAVAAVALTGCGKGLCTEYLDTQRSFAQKYGSVCEPDAAYYRFSDDAMHQCDANADTFCSDADQMLINAYSECFSKLPACTLSNKDSFKLQAEQCGRASNLNQLSDACRAITPRIFR